MVLVDDWIETGAQMKAAIALMEGMEVRVVGLAAPFVTPEVPANVEMMRRYKTFAENCFVCRKEECVCA